MSKKLNIGVINKALNGIEEFESPVSVLKDSSLFEHAIEEIIFEPLYNGEREAINQIASAVRPFFIECIDLAPEEQEKHIDKALDALDRLDTEPQIKNGVFDLCCRNFKIAVKNKRRASRPKKIWKTLWIVILVIGTLGIKVIYDNRYYFEIIGKTPREIRYLAEKYEMGIDDCTININKAVYFYEIAAEKGDTYAMNRLIFMYNYGY